MCVNVLHFKILSPLSFFIMFLREIQTMTCDRPIQHPTSNNTNARPLSQTSVTPMTWWDEYKIVSVCSIKLKSTHLLSIQFQTCLFIVVLRFVNGRMLPPPGEQLTELSLQFKMQHHCVLAHGSEKR
jgi:hypothetical protein